MCKMKKKQKVTFDADTKPPNCGHMKLHTKPIKRKDKDEDIAGLALVISQTGVTREMAIATLRKHDGDIVNAIMELVCP